MPTLVKGVSIKGGSHPHQFINPLGFGISQPGTNGAYRLPYLRGPAYMDHDLTVLKDFSVGEGKVLQLRAAAFNFLNHPLVSFNNNNTNNLNLGFQDGVVGAATDAKHAHVPGFRCCEYQGRKQAGGAGSEVHVLMNGLCPGSRCVN